MGMYRNKNTINREKFEKCFFYGIKEKREVREVREGILLFSSKKVYARHTGENWHEIPNKQFESEIIQEAIGPYRQFCRFVILNDKPEIIDQVVCLTSMDINDDTPNEFILRPAIKVKDIPGATNIRLIEGDDEDILDVNIEDLEKQLEKEIQRLKAEGNLIESKAGVFFGREIEKALKGGPQYIYGKGLVGEDAKPKQMYEILKQLEEIERQDEEEYLEYLYLTKFARAVNRGDKEEAERIKQKIEERAKRKEQEGREIE